MKKPKLNKRDILSSAEETYCQVKDATGNDRRAYHTAFPDSMSLPERTIEKRITRLNASPKVQKRIAELREACRKATDGKYDGLKEEMIDRIVAGIRKATDADPVAVIDCVSSMRILSDILGWNAPKQIAVHGPPAENYRPPSLANMTDEEISAKLKELRGL